MAEVHQTTPSGSEARKGWVRKWDFFVWSYTLDSANRDCFVQVVRRPLLGGEYTARYSRGLWMAGITFMIILSISASLFVISMMISNEEVDFSPVFIAFEVALFVPIYAILVFLLYFTFVPPKEFKSSHRR